MRKAHSCIPLKYSKIEFQAVLALQLIIRERSDALATRPAVDRVSYVGGIADDFS